MGVLAAVFFISVTVAFMCGFVYYLFNGLLWNIPQDEEQE